MTAVDLAALRVEAEERELAGDWAACEPQQMLALIEAVEAALAECESRLADGEAVHTRTYAALAPFRQEQP